jgi:hypothetical protein
MLQNAYHLTSVVIVCNYLQLWNTCSHKGEAICDWQIGHLPGAFSYSVLGDPLVSQLGHGCNMITYLPLGPTFYTIKDEFPSTSISKNGYTLGGGVY